MKSALPLLPTTLVGSYAQPDWLIDREKLGKRFPPRVRARELWRVAPEWLEQAQDDATVLAIRDQERAGLDIITDGEMRRESYSNRFATALDGVDIDNPGTALDRSGHPNPVPRVVGPIRRRQPGAGARRRVPAWPIPTKPDQDHRAGPLHHEPAGAGRLLQGRGGAGAWTMRPLSTSRSRTFSPPAPTSCRSMSLTCRRGPRRPNGSASKCSTARSNGIGGITAMHICFGYAAVIHNRPAGLFVSAGA